MEWENAILENTLKSYYKSHSPSEIQIQNFDYFIHHRLPKIIEEESTIETKINERDTFRVQFQHVHVDKPYVIDENRELHYISPTEARFRELNYTSSIFCDIRTSVLRNQANDTQTEINTKVYPKKLITKIPTMVKSSCCNLYKKSEEDCIASGECRYDPGGYFIIKGKERVLVSQERMNHNVVYVFDQKPTNKFLLIAEIRSMSEETRHSVFIQMKLHGKKVVLQLPYIQQEIPLGIVYRAYGFTVTEIEIILKFCCIFWKEDKTIESYINSILIDAKRIESQENAIHYICNFSLNTIMKERKQKYIIQILTNELFPHLGMTSLREHKGLFLGNMFHKLISTFTGFRKMDDRDHINNKRIELSGYLLCELFRTLFKRFIRTIEPQLEKRQDIVVITNRLNMITLGINHCMATGNWGIPKSNYIRMGVSQILSRLTYTSFCSHLRRILIPIGKEGKNTKVRQIHPSQIGFICPHETPEGQQSGIVKNMTPLTTVSLQYNLTFLREIIESNPDVESNFQTILQNYNQNVYSMVYYIFLNGNIIGYTLNFDRVWNNFRQQQERKIIPQHVSFSFSKIDREIHIFADEGRVQRPLFSRRNFPSIQDLKTKSFNTLVSENKILFLDSYQIENEIIAMTPEEMFSKDYFHYCEIHPSCISSLCVSLIPYNEHTQSPRITYHAAMGKQAIGLPFSNLETRVDTINHILSYPEKPITQSHHAKYNHGQELPFGNNLIVAVATYTGFNQEDSVIMSKSAIDRGLFRSFSYKMLVIEEKKKSTLLTEKIDRVPLSFQNKSFDYSKLDSEGIVKVGCYVGIGDVIVSKLQKLTDKMQTDNWHDNSVIIKSGEEGFVDKVFIMTNTEGYKIVKIRIRNYKIPEIGDKVASREAQKGTISIILNEEDMPFSESGIIPDLLINPLCLPSRMTVNQLIESYGNKAALQNFKMQYCTAFSQHSVDIIPRLHSKMIKNGFHNYGNEIMYNGLTGKQFDCSIFIGPTYYHRLKHLVSNKIHARNHGNIQALTRQPLEGRSRDGGLRFGEMERDTLDKNTPVSLSYGLSVPLHFLEDQHTNVLGWSSGKKGIVSSPCTHFLDKGYKNCLKITMADSREIICTPDHPMLSFHNKWIRAKNLKPSVHLKIGLQYPLIHHEEKTIMQDIPMLSIQNFLHKYSFIRLHAFFILKSFHPSIVISFFDTKQIEFEMNELNISSNYFQNRKCSIEHMSYLFQSVPTCCQREIIATTLPFYSHFSTSTMSLHVKQLPEVLHTLFLDFFIAKNIFLHNYYDSCSFEVPSESLYHLLHSVGFRYDTKKTFQLQIMTSFLQYVKNSPTNFDTFLENMHAYQSFSNDYILFDRLPSFSLPIRKIETLYEKIDVADIQVEKTQSFLANGIVAHNCMISHGVSRFLRERLFDVSDYFEIYTCICGNIPHSSTVCNVCGNKEIVKVALPFACKLLFQELIALGIKVEIKPKIIK
jgi:DNA-directed RNA polymerase II subunit RPB2